MYWIYIKLVVNIYIFIAPGIYEVATCHKRVYDLGRHYSPYRKYNRVYFASASLYLFSLPYLSHLSSDIPTRRIPTHRFSCWPWGDEDSLGCKKRKKQPKTKTKKKEREIAVTATPNTTRRRLLKRKQVLDEETSI